MIRIVLADDQDLVRAGLVALLQTEADIEVVSAVADGEGAIEAVRQYLPDIALLDIEMGSLSGLDVAELIHRDYPQTRIVMVTAFGRPGYLTRAMASGVHGYLVKDSPAAQLIATVRKVVQGLYVIDPDLATEAMKAGPNPLSEREREILTVCGRGGTISDIAQIVHLAEGTVRNHLSSAMNKLGARTRGEAHLRALEVGWL